MATKQVIHSLKIWPKYFEAITEGRKTFEVRRELIPEIPAGRGSVYEVGDILFLREWEEGREYTGRVVIRIVSHLTRGHTLKGPMAGLIGNDAVVMSLKCPPWEVSVESG